MNQRQIGTAIVIFGILISIIVLVMKETEDEYIRQIIMEHGECMLEDGTCLHADRNYFPIILGWTIGGAMILLGIYLTFIDRTQEIVAKHQIKVSKELAKATQSKEWDAFLKGFTKAEQQVLGAIKIQEGIKQSTLRYKTGLSKTMLSQMLSGFEKKEIIRRVEKGKTKMVYLKP